MTGKLLRALNEKLGEIPLGTQGKLRKSLQEEVKRNAALLKVYEKERVHWEWILNLRTPASPEGSADLLAPTRLFRASGLGCFFTGGGATTTAGGLPGNWDSTGHFVGAGFRYQCTNMGMNPGPMPYEEKDKPNPKNIPWRAAGVMRVLTGNMEEVLREAKKYADATCLNVRVELVMVGRLPKDSARLVRSIPAAARAHWKEWQQQKKQLPGYKDPDRTIQIGGKAYPLLPKKPIDKKVGKEELMVYVWTVMSKKAQVKK